MGKCPLRGRNNDIVITATHQAETRIRCSEVPFVFGRELRLCSRDRRRGEEDRTYSRPIIFFSLIKAAHRDQAGHETCRACLYSRRPRGFPGHCSDECRLEGRGADGPGATRDMGDRDFTSLMLSLFLAASLKSSRSATTSCGPLLPLPPSYDPSQGSSLLIAV